MALVRRTERNWMDPWRELDERMARLFEGNALAASDWAPSVDVSETDTEYRIKASLPDVKKEDMKLTLENGVLSISGKRESRKEEKNEKVHRTEIQTGTFFRSFSMPADADAEKVSAKYENGLLDVTIGKTAPKAPGARQIQVR